MLAVAMVCIQYTFFTEEFVKLNLCEDIFVYVFGNTHKG